jgi:hypothetical protein
MGRPPALDARAEEEAALLLDVGVRQTVVARACGVSTRTIQRIAARHRRDAVEPSLEQLLASLPSPEQVLAEPSHPVRKRKRKRRPAWRDVADALETQFPQRWNPPGVDVD